MAALGPAADRRWLLVDVAGAAPGPGASGAGSPASGRSPPRRRAWTTGRTRAAPRRACTASPGASGWTRQPGTVFVSREPTGAVWRPASPIPGDLILTRVLILDGLEDGLNRGPGVDSRERYIYIHGTNHEAAAGPARQRRLRAPDQPRRDRPVRPRGRRRSCCHRLIRPPRWLHFVGVGGSGMSALIQFHALAGGRATGSDRAFDQGERPQLRKALERLGVVITPQDGELRRGPGRPLRRHRGQHRGRGPGAGRGGRPRRRHTGAAPLASCWPATWPGTAPSPSAAPAASRRSRPWSSPSCARPGWARAC